MKKNGNFVFAFLHTFDIKGIYTERPVLSSVKLRTGRKKSTMDAKVLFDVLRTKYNFVNSTFTPQEAKHAFKLEVKPSKFFGRPDYLQMKVTGNARPVFISSCFEARTSSGLFNIEIAGRRIEALQLEDGAVRFASLYDLRHLQKKERFDFLSDKSRKSYE